MAPVAFRDDRGQPLAGPARFLGTSTYFFGDKLVHYGTYQLLKLGISVEYGGPRTPIHYFASIRNAR
jgi:hypothetical protein